MPASLRFVAILLGLGVATALASGIVQYRQSLKQAQAAAEAMSGGHVDAGKVAIERSGCGACHVIPGIAVASGKVGPSLRGVATRTIIAGKMQNTPQGLTAWVRLPQHLSPGTAMPEQPMSEQEARDIAAYLLTLRN
jgi:cytochrome c1